MERERSEYITVIPEAATGANNFVESGKMRFNPSADGRLEESSLARFLISSKRSRRLQPDGINRAQIALAGRDEAIRGCSLHLQGTKMRIQAPAAHLQSSSHFFPPKHALGGGELASQERGWQEWAVLHLPAPRAGRPSSGTTPGPNLTLRVPCTSKKNTLFPGGRKSSLSHLL